MNEVLVDILSLIHVNRRTDQQRQKKDLGKIMGAFFCFSLRTQLNMKRNKTEGNCEKQARVIRENEEMKDSIC
jgi:hypothetical protein